MRYFDRAGNRISMAQWFWLCAGGAPDAGPDHRPHASPPEEGASEAQISRWEMTNLATMMHDFPSDPERGERYKSVAYTEVAGRHISTVWTGVAIGSNEPPLFFETMIFASSTEDPDHVADEDASDASGETGEGVRWPSRPPMEGFDAVRYPDEGSAREGHAQIVAAFQQWSANMGEVVT